jgi:hypothetical protein
MQANPQTNTAVAASFEEDCRLCMGRLRSGLLDLYRSVSADPAKPQEVTRRFGVNRNLAWHISRLLRDDDILDTVPMVPRAGAADILLESMKRAGAPIDLVYAARRAFEDFDTMVETHAGDRADLDLLLDSMGRGNESLELSRKLAFKGNSGLLGMQVATRLTIQCIGPSATDPDMYDAIQIAGLCDVKRFRSIESWPVARIGRYNRESTPSVAPSRVPIDPTCTDTPGLMHAFCEGSMPAIATRQRGDGQYYDIGSGPVGKRGQFTCHFGFIQRNFVCKYAVGSVGCATIAAAITMPAERLQFDLFVHESVPGPVERRALVYAKTWDDSSGALDPTAILPIPANVIDLGPGGQHGSPFVNRYADLIAATFSAAQWDPARFRCHRVMLEFPPMSSVVAMQLRLPGRPA